MMDRLEINGKVPRSKIVTASGCRATTLETILLYSKLIPEIGVFTTKSIGPSPNPGNPPPIYCKDDSAIGARRNAVGLANPGHVEFASELKALKEIYPDLDGALLLGSAYGANLDEIVSVCNSMAPYVDAIEINFSCPHAKGYGLDTGKDADAMSKIVTAVCSSTKRDIFAKLSPNLSDDDLAEIAKGCVSAGAKGIVVVNTLAPAESHLPGTDIPVLFNRKGGLSGPALKQRGIACVKLVRDAIGGEPMIIGMGGIYSGWDARDYISAGADFIGLGTVLEGMDSKNLARYVKTFSSDMYRGEDTATKLLPSQLNLGYLPFSIEHIDHLSDNLRIFHLGGKLDMSALPAQYVFLAVPGDAEHPTMEAPFSVPISDPLELAVRRYPRGEKKFHFTSRLWEKVEGDTVFVRGPYGVPFNYGGDGPIYLVGGGTGIAALLSILGSRPDCVAFLGAKREEELILKEHFVKERTVLVTEDMLDLYQNGLVTEAFERYVSSMGEGIGCVVTCGPEKMMRKVVEISNNNGFADKDIYVITEPHMKCGVGICGSCSMHDGSIACVDGHIITADRFKEAISQGKVKRDACGRWKR